MSKNRTRYTVTITKDEEITEVKKGKWQVVGETVFTQEEFGEASYYKQEEMKKIPVKQVYGYPDATETVETTKTEVLKQTVSDLDLTAVIKAINGIE